MGIRSLHRLSAARVRSERRAGILEDGGGLRLVIDEGKEGSVTKRWVLRLTINGKRVNRGLGGYPAVSLEAARERAAELRKGARDGADLASEAKATRRPPEGHTTLSEAFDDFFALKEKGLVNPKHARQWRTTLETYAFPELGTIAVDQITPADVIRTLSPIWAEKPETARRVLQRLRVTIESWAIRSHRAHSLPWAGISRELNAQLTKGQRQVEHHRALPWRDVPAFYTKLSEKASVGRLALRWTILTAARSGETRGARWVEVDSKAGLWTVPGERMKGNVEHRVPLSSAALALLKEVRRVDLDGDLVLPAPRFGGVLSDMALTRVIQDAEFADRATVHGFRSSFKDWAGEHGYADEISEAALAHRDQNKVRRSYLRTDFLEQRRELMEAWGRFVAPPIPDPT